MTVRPCARSPRRPAGPGSPRRRTGRNRRRATGWGPGAEWRRPGSRDRRGSSLYAWDMVPPDSLIRLWVKSCHRIYALYYVLYITAKAIQWQGAWKLQCMATTPHMLGEALASILRLTIYAICVILAICLQ